MSYFSAHDHTAPPMPTDSPIRRVVLVGHCGFDASMLRGAVRDALPDVAIDEADSPAAIDAAAGPDALLLINRVLPRDVAGGSGVELIRGLTSRDADRRPATMLVSNLAGPQRDAESAGAHPGIGKAELGGETTRERLRDAAGR